MKTAKQTKVCKGCGGEFNREMFAKSSTSTAGNPTYTGWCKSCFVRRRSSIHKERVAKAASELGIELKCSRCGYSTCLSALDFHHCDDTTKEKGIGSMRGSSYESILREMKKCVILCKNCHVEIHSKE